MELSAEQLLAAIQRDFPREYEISALRLVNAIQAARLVELEPRVEQEPKQEV